MSDPVKSSWGDMNVFPSFDSYVVFSVDPYATLEYELSDDTIPHSDELDTIASRKYVGWVQEWLDLYMDDRPHHRWRIIHLRKGPNPSLFDGIDFIDSKMCIPVSPCINNPTPFPPLKLSKPLPWENCFHYSRYHLMDVRYPTTRSKDIPQYVIPNREDFRYRNFKNANYDRESAMKAKRLPLELDLSQPPLDDYNLSPYKAIIESMDGGLLPIVKFSYDLDSLEDFEDPFQYFTDVMYITDLIKELKQNAIEKARKMDEEAFPDKKPKLPGQDLDTHVEPEISRSKSRLSIIRHKIGKVFRLSTLISVLTCGMYYGASYTYTYSPNSPWGDSVSSYSAHSDLESDDSD